LRHHTLACVIAVTITTPETNTLFRERYIRFQWSVTTLGTFQRVIESRFRVVCWARREIVHFCQTPAFQPVLQCHILTAWAANA